MKQIAIFLAFTFVTSWVIAWRIWADGGIAESPLGGIYVFCFMFGPAVGALATAWVYERKRYARALGLKRYPFMRFVRWLPFAWGVPILLVTVAIGLSGLLNGQGFADPVAYMQQQIDAIPEGVESEVVFSPETLLAIQLAVGIPLGFLLNTVILTFSEEIGWRGWLQPKLSQQGLGFWGISGVTGVIWGVWHAPLIMLGHNYPGMPVTGPVLMIIFCLLLTPYLTLARERAGVWAAGAFHGAINAVAGFSLLFLPQESWVWNGLIGIAGFGVIAIGLVLLELWRRQHPVPAVPLIEPDEEEDEETAPEPSAV